MSTMRISELAQRAGVPATTLRFYESNGLLPAERNAAGYRTYGEDAVARLDMIGRAKRLGLPLSSVAELLEVWSSGACQEVKADLRPRLLARIAEIESQVVLAGLLHETVRHLDALPDLAQPCTDDCFATPPPVACSLVGGELDERLAQWQDLMRDGESIPNGVRLTLPAERAVDLVALAVAEQECCPSLSFSWHLAGPVVVMQVRGLLSS
jgi:MerR family transcriptional regulator, copper efflux regulator